MQASDPNDTAAEDVSKNESQADNTLSGAADRPKEIGGRGGLDPTRYGDWEKAGRCIDF